MEPTALTVAQITRAEAEALVEASIREVLGRERSLDGITLAQAAELLPGAGYFVIEWEGSDNSRVLRGVVVGGIEVGSVENAVARSIKGEAIGTAEHFVRYGGESGRQHKLLIILF